MAPARRPKKLDSEALWNYALHALGVRAHSAAELKRKLLRRTEHPSDVVSIMTKLHEYGLADDEKFSQNFASSRLQNEGFGRFRVLRELLSKSVAQSVAERAVTTAFAGTDEEQLAEAFLARKYRGKDLTAFLAEEKNLGSAYRRLRTAGFSAGASLSVLKRHSRRAEEWPDPEED